MMSQVSNANGVEHGTDFRSKEFRFLARSIGILALLTGFIYLRVIGMEALVSWQTNQGITAVIFLFGLIVLAMVGLMCGWRWELMGGFIAIISALSIGFISFFILPEYPLFSAIAYSSPFLIAGILTLVCWKKSNP
jgi:hypothetical protein